jgi:type III secretion system low calcium response chaperone LcrH/SycD
VAKEILGYNMDDPEQAAALVQKFREDLDSGKQIKEIFNVPDEMLEQVYGLAYRNYQAGDYDASAELFRNLVLLDPHNYRFLLGLAATLHRQKDYPGAATTYVLASMERPEEPVPYFHGADCFARSDQPLVAYAFYNQAIHYAGDDPLYAEIKEKSKLAKKPLLKKVKKSSD